MKHFFERKNIAPKSELVLKEVPEVQGSTLREAIMSDQVKRVRSLIDSGVNVDEEIWDDGSVLHDCARTGRVGIARWVVNAKANINLQSKQWGYTPLHEAIRYGQPTMVLWLLRLEGIDLSLKDKEGKIAFQHLKEKSVLGTAPEALEACQIIIDAHLKQKHREI